MGGVDIILSHLSTGAAEEKLTQNTNNASDQAPIKPPLI